MKKIIENIEGKLNQLPFEALLMLFLIILIPIIHHILKEKRQNHIIEKLEYIVNDNIPSLSREKLRSFHEFEFSSDTEADYIIQTLQTFSIITFKTFNHGN